MAEIVNLRQARKAKARLQADAVASQNRVSFGRTKAEKSGTATAQAIARSRHEGHRLSHDVQSTALPEASPEAADKNA